MTIAYSLNGLALFMHPHQVLPTIARPSCKAGQMLAPLSSSNTFARNRAFGANLLSSENAMSVVKMFVLEDIAAPLLSVADAQRNNEDIVSLVATESVHGSINWLSCSEADPTRCYLHGRRLF